MPNKENELLKQIEELKNEIKNLKNRKKYGLVWEDKPEQVVLDCQSKLPILKEVKNREIKTDKNKPVNILIEGDNYHSLSVLNYTHKEKVDFIYIDPPYNRGGDYRYNDDYIDKEDPFIHSNWLNFISNRLRLAKNLLSKDGIIFISIDDYEMANLKIICDKIFGSKNAIGPIIWQKASGGGNAKKVVVGHEYILCYSNKAITLTQKNLKHLNKDYKKSKKYLEKNGKIYFINDDTVRKFFGKYPKGVERRCEYEDLLKYKNKLFKEDVDEKISLGEYILIKNPNNPNRHFICALEEIKDARMVFYSIIQGIFNAEGKEDLVRAGLTEEDFDYPKPIRLIKLLIDSIEKDDLTILDFFAGSGTTGHAVLELNKEDGGNRKFILCTNNENKIAEEVCYPRISNVIKGYKNKKGEKVEGLGGNLKYYKTDFVDSGHINKISDDSKIKLTYQAGELIALRENTLDEVEKNEWWQIFADGEKQTAIYFKEDKSKLQKLVEKLSKNKKSVLYIFSWGKNEYKNEFLEHKNIRIEDIPEPIIEVYKELNKL